MSAAPRPGVGRGAAAAWLGVVKERFACRHRVPDGPGEPDRSRGRCAEATLREEAGPN